MTTLGKFDKAVAQAMTKVGNIDLRKLHAKIEQNMIKAQLQALYDKVVAENAELREKLALHQDTIRRMYRELEAIRNGEE
jgi:hypothetical protein